MATKSFCLGEKGGRDHRHQGMDAVPRELQGGAGVGGSLAQAMLVPQSLFHRVHTAVTWRVVEDDTTPSRHHQIS